MSERPTGAAPGGRGPGFVGLLRLDTTFPRPVGDVGNPNTFDFPVRTVVVRGATAARVVRGDAAPLLAPFVEAGRILAADGAVAIATSCGFLAAAIFVTVVSGGACSAECCEEID